MVSTKTQIAGFEFDNCLMNAAGVACMTIAELEGVKNSGEELGQTSQEDIDNMMPMLMDAAGYKFYNTSGLQIHDHMLLSYNPPCFAKQNANPLVSRGFSLPCFT